MATIKLGILRAIAAFAAREDIREYLRAVYFYSKDGHSYVFAIDGHKAAIHRFEKDKSYFNCEQSLTGIPVETIDALLKLNPRHDDDRVEFEIKVSFLVELNGVRFTGKAVAMKPGIDAIKSISPENSYELLNSTGLFNAKYLLAGANLLDKTIGFKSNGAIRLKSDEKRDSLKRGFYVDEETTICIMAVKE
jgi:hypothetical protein